MKQRDNIIKTDVTYTKWICSLKTRYRNSQIKAASSVNREMLLFYWNLGRDIALLRAESRWGSRFVDTLSFDLRKELPDAKGFSRTNIFYMIKFYRLYTNEMILQDGGQFENAELIPQVGGQFEAEILSIPWGHHKLIMDKCKDDKKKALFYVRKTIENNLSRAVLLNFLATNLYERQGKAMSNFVKTLPAPQSDLAQEITKDPYNFDFLTLTEGYHEKELKDALMDNLGNFLLELGNGFAFVGREVALEIGETENFVDMLFYNIKLHCYVVVEVKVGEFNARDMGQLGTYMVAVNHQIKGDKDGPTLVLIICKSKDNVKAQYALEASSQPMGITEYDISRFLPENYKSSLPSIEEIETELADVSGLE